MTRLLHTFTKLLVLTCFLIHSAFPEKTSSTNAYLKSKSNNTTKEETGIEEARKKEEKDMMSKIMPMMVIPFMVSTAMIPMMLISLKIMLIKSAFIGKLAVILLMINMLRSRSNGEGGVFNHNVNLKEMSMGHYGYNGDQEYGAYINRRKRSLR